MELDRLLKLMTDKGASDLHLKPTRPPLLRISGRLLPLEAETLTMDVLSEMLLSILNPRQKAKLEEKMSVDLGYGVRGLARFRCNIYMQRGNIAACFRRIPYQIKSLEDLDLPKVLLEFCSMPMGLVLVTGPTGSGKTVSLYTCL
ncbi:MAG TPA: type IV pili twitching motility protein PilT, partial [Acidobacteria bacterium]|nr:type IV pili twitching motility protein PilT [Acidobacteriota bacterium]